MSLLQRLVIYDRQYELLADISGGDDYGADKANITKGDLSSVLNGLTLSDYQNRKRRDKLQHAKQDEAKLILGACFSLKSVLGKLCPGDGFCNEFYWDCAPHPSAYRLLYYRTATRLTFIAIVKQPSKATGEALRTFYDQIYVPLIVKSPFYRLDGIYHQQQLLQAEPFRERCRIFFQQANK